MAPAKHELRAPTSAFRICRSEASMAAIVARRTRALLMMGIVTARLFSPMTSATASNGCS